MSSHTPGPWHTGDGTVGRRIVYDARGMAIADAKVFHGNRTGGEDFANARLIAAAPELYDAASNALDTLLSCCVAGDGVDDREAMLEAQQMLRAAIRKAMGEE